MSTVKPSSVFIVTDVGLKIPSSIAINLAGSWRGGEAVATAVYCATPNLPSVSAALQLGRDRDSKVRLAADKRVVPLLVRHEQTDRAIPALVAPFVFQTPPRPP